MLNHLPRAPTVKSPALPQVMGVFALVPLKFEGVGSINSLFDYTVDHIGPRGNAAVLCVERHCRIKGA
jgi:hypothetical protein